MTEYLKLKLNVMNVKDIGKQQVAVMKCLPAPSQQLPVNFIQKVLLLLAAGPPCATSSSSVCLRNGRDCLEDMAVGFPMFDFGDLWMMVKVFVSALFIGCALTICFLYQNNLLKFPTDTKGVVIEPVVVTAASSPPKPRSRSPVKSWPVSSGVDKATQAQVTYKRKLSTPRFAPLNDGFHGCW